MIDLTKMIGLEIGFDENSNNLIYSDSILIPNSCSYKFCGLPKDWKKDFQVNSMSNAPLYKSLKIGYEFKKNNHEPNEEELKKIYEKEILYYGRQAIWDNHQELEYMLNGNIRPDITVLLPGTLGEEFLRTEGHHHRSGLPEIYQTVYGNNIYLLFRTDSIDPKDDQTSQIKEVLAVFAEQGDFVLFPPGYQHISINVGKTPFIMTDLVSTKADSNFESIKQHNGAPYWVLKGQKGHPVFERNPNYYDTPPLKLLEPRNIIKLRRSGISENYLASDEPIFSQYKRFGMDLFYFLNRTSGDEEIYNNAFIQLTSEKYNRMFE